MYLKNITINNFRGIKSLSLDLHPGLNILIGENNAGKTAIIDALRICLNFGNIQRDKYFNKNTDFFIDKTNPNLQTIETRFDLFFKVEDLSEISIYRELLNVNSDGTHDLQLHFKYYIDNEKLRYKVWGGSLEGQQVSQDILQLINYVHLDALRDAEQYLRPYKGSKISALYDGLQDYNKTQKDTLANQISDVFKQNEWKAFINSGKSKINEHLENTTFETSDKKQKIEVTPTGFGISEILNNLRIQIPVFDEAILNGQEQRYMHLSQNGLGYNNIIYISTILGDIVQRKEKDEKSFYSLLIEEPEAHLHPQLQSNFFSYLNTLSKQNKFQIFVTSHSPIITAKADLDTLIVLQSQNNEINALPIRKSSLSADNKVFLRKFLDVTKAQLFFSNGIILVEGVEAFLMPIFAKKMGKTFDLDRNAIEVIITGTSFKHFSNLYIGDNCLKNKCSILTDDDRDLAKASDFNKLFIDLTLTVKKDINENKQSAKKRAKLLFKMLCDKKFIDKYNRITDKFTPSRTGFSMKLGTFAPFETEVIEILNSLVKKSDRTLSLIGWENDKLKVFDADITFEYDLLTTSEDNFKISVNVWEKIHPNIAKEIRLYKKSVSLEKAALFFLDKISIAKGGKSDFSYHLTRHLESTPKDLDDFKVPDYIQKAIKWVVKGE